MTKNWNTLTYAEKNEKFNQIRETMGGIETAFRNDFESYQARVSDCEHEWLRSLETEQPRDPWPEVYRDGWAFGRNRNMQANRNLSRL